MLNVMLDKIVAEAPSSTASMVVTAMFATGPFSKPICILHTIKTGILFTFLTFIPFIDKKNIHNVDTVYVLISTMLTLYVSISTMLTLCFNIHNVDTVCFNIHNVDTVCFNIHNVDTMF